MGTSTTMVRARVSTWLQVRPLRLPTSQPSAACASNCRPGEQIVGGAGAHPGDADADQDDPVAGGAVLPRQQVDQQGGAQRAEQAQRLDAEAAVPAEHDAGDDGGAGPLGEADHVGAGQRIAGHGLEQRPGDAEGDAHQQAGQGARQPQLLDDQYGAGVAGARQGLDDVREGDRVVADGDAPAQEQEHGEDEGRADEDQPGPQHAGDGRHGEPEGPPGAAVGREGCHGFIPPRACVGGPGR
jgi:hypothetical protein